MVGVHGCPGPPLARMMPVMTAELLARTSGFAAAGPVGGVGHPVDADALHPGLSRAVSPGRGG